MIYCEFENGSKASLRHVTVKALTVNDKNEVLLTKRAFHLLGGGKYDIPGGFLDRDEDTKDCALRELNEETGLKGKIMFLLRINDSPKRRKEDRQNLEIIYVVKSIVGEFKMDNETLSADWFSEKNIPSEEEFAFDHRDSILKYFQYLIDPFSIPIVG